MNIVLVGMPGAGKSTIGPMLAAKKGMDYIDTDIPLKESMGCELKDFVEKNGFEAFLNKQQELILSMKIGNTVVGTGGSVVCSEAVMAHLKIDSLVVYLMLDFYTIEKRLSPERKLARSTGKSLIELYNDRVPLYEKYADIIIDCSNRTIDSIVEEISLQI